MKMDGFIKYIIICLSIFIGTSYGLSCYQCRSTRVSDCTTDDLHQKIMPCGASHPEFVQFCIFKVVYDYPLQATVASSNCESVQKSSMQNWQTIERDFCQSGYSQQVHQCRICLTDLCNNPALPYLQNTGSGSYPPNYGSGVPGIPGAPGMPNALPGPYIPNTGPGAYGYIPSAPRPPQTYGGYYRGTSVPVIFNNSPYLALGIAAVVHLLTN